ncbi:MAG TPA: tail fiber domain-containing protein [Pyrinomonadaceae bacterium]|nr:tail fiber domain-containing protein [Pyrinomonadaceae bacterium]
MKNVKTFGVVVFALLVLVSLQTVAVQAQKLANVSSKGASVKWEVAAQHAGLTITISAPDGQVYQKEFPAGSSPEFILADKEGNRLPDGQYTYEIRLNPVLGAGVKEELAAARRKGDDAKVERDLRKRGALPSQGLVESGSFSILNGSVVVPGAVEGQRSTSKLTEQQRTPFLPSGNTVTRLRNHRLSLLSMPDQVIPDDLIVQGSACVGLDCVNNENFGFDTIRLKENNTRIQFDDTSSAAGFPTNNWQIRANDSASGGASFLGFVDQGASGNSETGTIVFSVAAGAPANSVKVDSSGRLGLRTATPVLDIHANTSNTPAIRLEQNSGGGFTAQTWDIAGNEANFFVRDVTGGSRLPFRVRPGAPTSSIDINASGFVGIGTASPQRKLHVLGPDGSVAGFPTLGAKDNIVFENNANNNIAIVTGATSSGGLKFFASGATVNAGSIVYDHSANAMTFFTNGVTERMRITSTGSVGIGTPTPDQLLSVNGDASKTGGNTWLSFSDERLKNIKGTFNSGLRAVMRLQPIRYEYKPDNALGLKSEGEHVGFSAQSLQKVIPEAVTKNGDGYLMVNSDPILWTMLNAIKEQQKEIADLKAEVQKLRAASHRRRK